MFWALSRGNQKDKRFPHCAPISILAHTHLNLISLRLSWAFLLDWLTYGSQNLGVQDFCRQPWSTRHDLTEPPEPWGGERRIGGAFPPTKPRFPPLLFPLRLIPALKLKSILFPVALNPSSSHLPLHSVASSCPPLPEIQLHHMIMNPG